MGVKGLFAFLKRENIQGGIKTHSLDDLIQQIQKYHNKFNKKPKILIDLRAFNHYYEQNVKDVVFGGRLNSVKQDFEKFLSSLKNAGAELIFASKSIKDWKAARSVKDYNSGIDFLKEIRKVGHVDQLVEAHRRQRQYPWNESTILVMTQSAMKFGEFRENDCPMREKKSAARTKMANDEDVFVLIGLNTSYLFFEGNWRFFYPMIEQNRHGQVQMTFKEYDKQTILKHFNLSIDQMQLFRVLAEKFSSTEENEQMLSNYFSVAVRGKYYTDFPKIISFVQKSAPRDKFPLQDEQMKDILREIFGYADDNLLDDFKLSLDNNSTNTERDETLDEINELIQNNPYSLLAQKILNNFPIDIESWFLDVTATDMESLKNLTLPWMRRVCGVLLKKIEKQENRKIIYHVDTDEWEHVDIEPIFPTFDIPSLKQLLKGEMSKDEKFQMLVFLINDLIDKKNLEDVPNDFIMHDIIVKYLVENDSMTTIEAQAIDKTVKDQPPRILIYPLTVNVRLFRVGVLYRKMYEVLLHSFYACGLEEFIADLKFDSVLFQNNYANMCNEE